MISIANQCQKPQLLMPSLKSKSLLSNLYKTLSPSSIGAPTFSLRGPTCPHASLIPITPTLDRALRHTIMEQLVSQLPTPALVLSRKDITEIVSLATLVSSTSALHETCELRLKDANNQDEIQLTGKEVLLLAAIIHEIKASTGEPQPRTLILSPDYANHCAMERQFSNFNELPTSVHQDLSSRLDKTPSHIAMDLSEDTQAFQSRTLDRLLSPGHHSLLLELVQHQKRLQGTVLPSQFFSLPECDAIVNTLSHMYLQIFQTKALYDKNTLLLRPLSEQEKPQVLDQLRGKMNNLILSSRAQQHTTSTTSPSIEAQIRTAVSESQEIPKSLGPFSLNMPLHGIPMAKCSLEPTLDQLEPFFSELFQDRRFVDGILLTEAKSNIHSAYSSLHTHMQLFARETILDAFIKAPKLSFIASTAVSLCQFLHQQEHGDLSSKDLQLMQSLTKDYFRNALAHELQNINFFQSQPPVMKKSPFAMNLYNDVFNAVADGLVPHDGQLPTRLNHLLNDLTRHSLASHLNDLLSQSDSH